MYRALFNFVKRKIPKISDTELIALRSGDVSIDRQILEGQVKLPKKELYNEIFPKEKLDNLLNNFDNTFFSKSFFSKKSPYRKMHTWQNSC